jgi:hypothetical protein
MATAAAKQTAPPRASLGRAQRRKIRKMRSELGMAIWELNESDVVDHLRNQYKLQKRWDPSLMDVFSSRIKLLVIKALEVNKELKTFVDRGGRMRKGARQMPKQYLDRLKGASLGIELGVEYLISLTPDELDLFADENLGSEAADLTEMLFFGFCPIRIEVATGIAPVGRRREAQIQEQIEVLKARERVAKSLQLFGMAEDAMEARKEIEASAGSDDVAVITEKGGCYTNGIKALRAAVMLMFYTVQARDVMRVKLDKKDSDNWRYWMEKSGEPHPEIVESMESLADEEGRVVHVFGHDNAFLYAATPKFYLGEDPESMAQRASLKQSKAARKDWSFDFAQKRTPADASEFHSSLSAVERRRVGRVLQKAQEAGWTLSMEQVTFIAQVPFISKEESAFRRKSAAQFSRNPDEDPTTEIAQDHGLITLLWGMDLG